MSRDRGGSERGSVAIVVALSLTLLLAFAALVVDVGLNWAARTSAQTAADSAALAGASTLLLDGPAAAFDTVEDFLTNNQIDLPAAAGWADDGLVSNGEVVCWTMPDGPPDPPPGPGLNCPEGSNALQVITPPINVQYAFAPVLGRTSNSIKATAAAGAGPAAPNNCVLCLLEPSLDNALAVTSNGGVDVSGGGIVVNSAHATAAAVLSGGGDVRANQIRIIGGVDDDPGGGQFIPPPELGGPTVPDPLADLPTPDALAAPPACCSGPQLVVSDTTLSPGVYDSISVSGNATLTLEPGVYVLTDLPGLSVTGNAQVAGSGVTVYLACSSYPAPCAGPGAPLSLALNGRYLASAPTSGEYAGLTLFSDRGNTAPIVVANNTGLNLDGALYAAGAPLTLTASPGLRVDGLLVTGTLLLDGNGPVDVNYNPDVLLPGYGPPVLIR
jgi:Putative Flp pilus-assembly TadE/G-like